MKHKKPIDIDKETRDAEYLDSWRFLWRIFGAWAVVIVIVQILIKLGWL